MSIYHHTQGRRKHSYTTSGSVGVTMKPIKRIGRHVARLYCERCGAKRTACRCSEVDHG